MRFTKITFVSVILFVVAAVKAQTRASFGEPCSRTNRCDSRASLTCNNGTCECIMPDLMTFDGAQCAVLSGEKCTFTAVDLQKRGEEKSWREELPCVQSSLCQDGFCTCFSEFYESGNGTCIEKHDFREECKFDLACKNKQFLICNDDKRCGCNSTTSTFDLSRKSCAVMANLSCENGEKCVSNAQCVENMCKCGSNYFANSTGECETKRGYNEPCEIDSHCQFGTGMGDLQLICNPDGHCDCNETISTFDSARKICARMAGEICTDITFCVDNSDCAQSEIIGKDRVCKCGSEHFQTSTGTCERRRGYLKECQSDENCNQGLACGTSGLCECDRDMLQQIFDPTKGKCVGLADTQCTSSYECIENSFCNGFNIGWGCGRRGDCPKGNCRCNDNYLKSENGTCLASYRQKCGFHITNGCLETQGTECKQGKCECKFNGLQAFESEKQKCVSRISGPCDENVPCGAEAHCSNLNETFHQCVCNDGFVPVDGDCLLEIGQACETKYNNNYADDFSSSIASKICDKTAPLLCLRGICQCDYLEEYDYQTKKCRGLVGSRCESRGQGFCMYNAECVSTRATKTNVNKVKICKCKQGWTITRQKRCIAETVQTEDSKYLEFLAFGTSSGENITEHHM